ncbi:HD domain-containing protein [Spirosoma endbachense]|uniref:Phosphohydrolase n=1 Tax=Spirosoma endbachense TaxID=2666025 RepID=A0A6P1W259_9BACT|nr:HD domain-containing protein [Spirosoma endbachense]QHV97756.1 phosphohydrolase [Spirosoma endbachense]
MNNSIKEIDDILQKFKPIIGEDYEKYRNHVYRVFLNCLLIDNKKENEEKYAIATVFHDIGIWTNHTIDYLDPSVEQAKIYLAKMDKKDWINEISLMIYWHHKTTKYQGEFTETVENFRKADWIDVSLGLLTFGYDKQKIEANRKQLPNLGFHAFLIRATTKNFFRHPLNPLPMFRK